MYDKSTMNTIEGVVGIVVGKYISNPLRDREIWELRLDWGLDLMLQ
jgi:hypothetical protein